MAPPCSPLPPPPPIPGTIWYLQTTGLQGMGVRPGTILDPWHAPGFRCVRLSYAPDDYEEIPEQDEFEQAITGSLNPSLPASSLEDCLEQWRDLEYGAWWLVDYRRPDKAPVVRCVLTGSHLTGKGNQHVNVPDPTGLLGGRVTRTVLDGPWFGGYNDCDMAIEPCCSNPPGEDEGPQPQRAIRAKYTTPGYYLIASWETPTVTSITYLSSEPTPDVMIYTIGYATADECEDAQGMP